jgi:hypothetical protein
MPEDDPILAEIAANLAEAETFAEESREELELSAREIRELVALMARKRKLPAEEREQIRRDALEAWRELFEACKDLERKDEAVLQALEKKADADRNLAMSVARGIHHFRTVLDSGNFEGTWEQREALVEQIREFDENREELLAGLTAEDIRQLRDEGVL